MNIKYAVFFGLFAFAIWLYRRKARPTPNPPYLITCDSCGHVDDYYNFDPVATNYYLTCPACNLEMEEADQEQLDNDRIVENLEAARIATMLECKALDVKEKRASFRLVNK